MKKASLRWPFSFSSLTVAAVSAAFSDVGRSPWQEQPVSSLEEPHLHAGQLDHIVVDELACLAADGGAVDQRKVVRRIAVHVHDEEPFLAARDRGDLDAGPAERRQRLVQLELATRE